MLRQRQTILYREHHEPNIAQPYPYWQAVHDKTGTNFITTLLCLYTVCSSNTHAVHWCVMRTGNSFSVFVPSPTRSLLFYHLLYIPGNMQMALFCLTCFFVVVVLYHSFLCIWVINLRILFRVVSVALGQPFDFNIASEVNTEDISKITVTHPKKNK